MRLNKLAGEGTRASFAQSPECVDGFRTHRCSVPKVRNENGKETDSFQNRGAGTERITGYFHKPCTETERKTELFKVPGA